MVWTEITRARYCRDGLRYASDTTDEEWAMIAPYMPCKSPRPAACDRDAGIGEFDLFHRSKWLPVAVATEGVSALHDGAAVLLPVARRWHLAGSTTILS
jgi:hypothetical protein